MEILICLSSALIGGLLMSRIAKLLRLPAVTAYLVAGLLLGPFGIGALRFGDIGFPSMEAVGNLNTLSQTALGFIAFAIGKEFRVGQLKAMGRQAIVVGILQAVTATMAWWIWRWYCCTSSGLTSFPFLPPLPWGRLPLLPPPPPR